MTRVLAFWIRNDEISTFKKLIRAARRAGLSVETKKLASKLLGEKLAGKKKVVKR